MSPYIFCGTLPNRIPPAFVPLELADDAVFVNGIRILRVMSRQRSSSSVRRSSFSLI
jgi:hypothetical protein